MKCVWMFLCDRCDHAGIWDVDLDALEFFVGTEISMDQIQDTFGSRVVLLGQEKMLITAFVEFQYGDLNPENRVHKSVLNRIKTLAPNKDLTSPLKGAKDKDKEKDKEGECEGILLKLYARYPLKKGKSAGLKKLRSDLKKGASIEEINQALDRLIAYHQAAKTEKAFLPQFKTWANSWRDCLDPDYGEGTNFANTSEHGAGSLRGA